MRPRVPMHNARVLDHLLKRMFEFGNPRLASGVSATRSFFTNPS